MFIDWSNFKANAKDCADAFKTLTLVAALACCTIAPQPAQAQGFQVRSGNGGIGIQAGGVNINLGNGPRGNTLNNLPPTNLDSFVYQSGYNENIYGDEGVGGDKPPFYGFTQNRRIDAGITGVNAAGLTTGHGSYLPCAWGADEFLAPPGEWCVSGNGSGGQSIQASALDAADLLEASIGLGTINFNLNYGGNTGSGLGGLFSGGGGGLGSILNGLGVNGGVNVGIDGGGVDISGGGSALGGLVGGGFNTGFGF